jgi:hypothetical protein
MAKIIDIKSALNKAQQTPSKQDVTRAHLGYDQHIQIEMTTNRKRTCKKLLESLKTFADLVDKQVADIGNI